MKIGFDNDKYLELQAQHIRERMSQFGGKLYLEFGGKLFDDHHASRVLPGFQPDSKIRMLATMKDDVEIVMAICAGDIEKNKVRGDLGITYDVDVLRLIDAFRSQGLFVGSVVITQYAGQPAADAFKQRCAQLEEGDTMLCLKKIAPTRLIKNQLYDSIKEAEDKGATADELRGILGKAASKRGIFEGDLDGGELEIGQIASGIREIQTAGEIVARMMHEYAETRERILNSI